MKRIQVNSLSQTLEICVLLFFLNFIQKGLIYTQLPLKKSSFKILWVYWILLTVLRWEMVGKTHSWGSNLGQLLKVCSLHTRDTRSTRWVIWQPVKLNNNGKQTFIYSKSPSFFISIFSLQRLNASQTLFVQYLSKKLSRHISPVVCRSLPVYCSLLLIDVCCKTSCNYICFMQMY